MLKMYVKKPTQVQAVQWNGTNFDEIQGLCSDMYVECGILKLPISGEDGIAEIGEVGSYVTKDPDGSWHICPRCEFEDQYAEDDGRHYVCAGSFY